MMIGQTSVVLKRLPSKTTVFCREAIRKTHTAETSSPLHGIKVLDLTRVLAVRIPGDLAVYICLTR